MKHNISERAREAMRYFMFVCVGSSLARVYVLEPSGQRRGFVYVGMGVGPIRIAVVTDVVITG